MTIINDSNILTRSIINWMISFLKTLIVSDVMDDVKNVLYVLAEDRDRALKVLKEQWQKIRRSMQTYWSKGLWKSLKIASKILKTIPLKNKLSKSKKIALLGDFFARRDYCTWWDSWPVLTELGPS